VDLDDIVQFSIGGSQNVHAVDERLPRLLIVEPASWLVFGSIPVIPDK
jgi:hypothetical protein